MSEDLEGKKSTRKRGAGFPALALDESAELVRKAGKYGNTVPLEALAQYAGHSTANSGPFKGKTAALRDWGFVTGRGDELELTELAKRIAHPVGADDERKALREAFGKPAIFAETYQRSAKGVVLDVTHIANGAVRQHGVSAASKNAFGRSFARSVVAAGLGHSPEEGKLVLAEAPDASDVLDGRGDGAPDDGVGAGNGAEGSGGNNGAGSGGRARRQSADLAPVFTQPWDFPGGHVLFELSLARPLPVEAFEHLQRVHTAVSELISTLSIEETDDEPSSSE